MSPAMENAALGNDAVVDDGARVVSKANGMASESGKQVLEEMEFQEIVEKHEGENEEGQIVVPRGY